MRRYFGTDGVRGVVGEDLTAELVERLGKASTLWSGRGRVFVGRDTRGSGPELEEAFARGVVAAGGNAVLAGVLPTPAVALLALDLGVVISASHNPPEYNGVKFFDAHGSKLVRRVARRRSRRCSTRPQRGRRHDRPRRRRTRTATSSTSLERFGTDLAGLRIAVDCANGAYAGIAPEAFERLGAEVTAIGDEPDGENINEGCGATDLALLQETVRAGGHDLGVAFDGDGDRMLAVDGDGNAIDGDQILAILALHLDVDLVAVTVMTNLGFHRLMDERGIRVVTTPVGDRYVLEALRRENGILGGEQSGHVICLRDHVTGDGLAAALLLCDAVRGRTLREAAAVMPLYAQAKENVRVSRREVPQEALAEAERLNAELNGSGRVLVRASGTEPLIRVLGEAETEEKALQYCARIAALVKRELG